MPKHWSEYYRPYDKEIKGEIKTILRKRHVKRKSGDVKAINEMLKEWIEKNKVAPAQQALALCYEDGYALTTRRYLTKEQVEVYRKLGIPVTILRQRGNKYYVETVRCPSDKFAEYLSAVMDEAVNPVYTEVGGGKR